MLLKVRREAKRPLLVGTVILLFLSIFTKSQALSPFEALNSAHLSKSQMDVRPSVQKTWRTMAFYRVSTGDSVITVLLPGEFHGTEEPGGLQSMGSQRVGHNCATNFLSSLFFSFSIC